MGFDMLPWDNMQSKKKLLEQAVSENWRLVIYHEPDTPIVTASAQDNGRFSLSQFTE
jgi:hypothetical protein